MLKSAFLLVALCFALASCVNDEWAKSQGPMARYGDYEQYRPTLEAMARMRSANSLTDNPLTVYQVTDLDVLNYAEQVKNILRAKFTSARFARYASATTQVLLGGAAGIAAAFSAGAGVVAGLAFSSAAMPQLGGIFNAKARAETYQEGVQLIEQNEVDFLAARHGQVSSTELTSAGAVLYRQVTATVHVVEKAIAGQLPTLKEMQDAAARQAQLRPTVPQTPISAPLVSHPRGGTVSGATLGGPVPMPLSVHERQKALINRIKKMSPQDAAALVTQFAPAAAPGPDPRKQLQGIVIGTEDPQTLSHMEQEFSQGATVPEAQPSATAPEQARPLPTVSPSTGTRGGPTPMPLSVHATQKALIDRIKKMSPEDAAALVTQFAPETAPGPDPRKQLQGIVISTDDPQTLSRMEQEFPRGATVPQAQPSATAPEQVRPLPTVSPSTGTKGGPVPMPLSVHERQKALINRIKKMSPQDAAALVTQFAPETAPGPDPRKRLQGIVIKTNDLQTLSRMEQDFPR